VTATIYPFTVEPPVKCECRTFGYGGRYVCPTCSRAFEMRLLLALVGQEGTSEFVPQVRELLTNISRDEERQR